MDDVAGGRLVEFLARDAEFALGFFLIASDNRFPDTAYGRSHGAADASVAKPADVVLAESFLGALSVWHVIGGGRWAAPEGDQREWIACLFDRTRFWEAA